MRPIHRNVLAGLTLVFGVILVYLPVWHAGFIWDDGELIAQNPCIVGPLGLKEIWTTSAADICPLTLTAFWIEHALWGLHPLGYHLVTVLLHAGGAIVLWRVLRKLNVPGAWLGAALWALHPVESESVAWISEMKNTQSGLFYLLSILFFVKSSGTEPEEIPRGKWNYALALFFAALALASKSSTVILPVVLALCLWWKEGRWQGRHLAKLMPFFFLALLAGVATLWTQRAQDVNELIVNRSWPERLAGAGHAVCFYLGKLIWPYPLMTLYPHGSLSGNGALSYLPLLIVAGAFLVLWLKRESNLRPCFFAFAYFLVALLPVLGFANNSFFQYSFVADHFQYLASMGPLALAGAGIVRLSKWAMPGKIWGLFIPSAAVLLLLGVLTWHRAGAYENQETLWSDTLAKNPGCAPAYDNLGWLLAQKGRTDEALAFYQKALQIDPDSFGAHYNLGNLLFQTGQVDEALVQYRKAVEIRPRDAEARTNLGVALLQRGQANLAIDQYRKALALNPHSFGAHYNFGYLLSQTGQGAQAIVQYREALKINPNVFAARFNLGNLLLQNGRAAEAILQYQEALRVKPDSIEAQNNLAKARVMAGHGS